MESAEAPLIRTRYVIDSKIKEVEQRFRTIWNGGVGHNATFAKVAIGWFVHIDGSYEALYVGYDKPDLVEGDPIRITIERMPNAKPR